MSVLVKQTRHNTNTNANSNTNNTNNSNVEATEGKDALPDEEYVLWVKGADNVMLARANATSVPTTVNTHLSNFASEGLRTLVLGKKTLTAADAAEWLKEYQYACESVDNRKGKLSDMAEKIETNIDIVGVTAIEDRLQEGVPETIRDLLRAGIKLWVLTGDKVETAINIGFSSKLLKPQTTLIRVVEGEDAMLLKEQLRGLCKTFKALTTEARQNVVVREVFIVHVGCTRCVPSSTDHIMNIPVLITLNVEFIRTCICLFLFDVGVQ
jgi:magnesium-transporting ATPase (P-type)